MIDRKEVELLVRAKLQGKSDLAAITKSITELEKALESQTEAAKKGEGSVDDLRDSYKKLEAVAAQLASAGGLIGAFQKQTKAIEKTDASLKSQAARLEEVNAKYRAAGVITEAHQKRLDTLATSYERSNAKLNEQRVALGSLETELRDAGIATTDLANASNRILEAAAQTGLALNRNAAAQASYNADLRAAVTAQKAKAAADREAVKLADDKAAAQRRDAEATAAVARAERDAASATAANNARNRDLDSSNAVRQASEAARRGAEYIRFWKEELQKADDELVNIGKRNAELNKVADSAGQTAREFSTLARASTNLAPKVISLRDAVNSITNPASAVRATLSGVEAEVRKLGTSIDAIKGPVKDYETQFKALAAASKALGSQAGLVDGFRRQVEVLRASRGEFAAARADVTKYADAVRQGGDAGASFTKPLADAQVRLKAASAAMREQVIATRQSRDALRQAGIDTNNLAAAEARLTDVAKATTVATTQLGAAVAKYGTAADRVAKQPSIFGADGGRTTLSLMQRIRGQVLALAAAYVGLQGVIGIGKGAIDATNSRQGAKNQLAISVGPDRQAIDAEYEYVKSQSERIGIEFETAIRGYAKFSAAASLAGRSRQEIRFIFEALSEVGRVANLSTEDLDGVFKAMEQIVSKGKIQAEELRGQLGDRLFGAFQVAAASLKDTFPDLDKALQGGLVTSDQLVKIVARYKEIVSGQLPEATVSLAAQQARLNNAVYDFKLLVADGGFADSFKGALIEITDFLRSDDGKQFAQGLSTAFSRLAKLLIFVAQNFDVIKIAITGLVAAKTVAGIGGMVTNFVALTAAVKGATGAVGGIQKAFILLQVFIAAWTIGTVLYEKFAVVRQIGAFIVATLVGAFKIVVAGVETAMLEVPRAVKNAFAIAVNSATSGVRLILKSLSLLSKAAGATDLGAAFDKAIDSLTVGYVDQQQKVDDIKKQLVADLKELGQLVVDAGKDTTVAVKKAPGAVATAQPDVGNGKKPPPTEAEIAKRARQIEEITKALESLDAKIERTQTDSLESQLNAVDIQYQALARKISKLGGAEEAKFQKQLTQSTQELKLQITRQFNDKLLAEQEALQTKLENAEVSAGKKDKLNLDSRLAAIKDSYADTYRDIAALAAKLSSNNRSTDTTDAMRKRLDGAVLELQNLERRKVASEQVKAAEEALNDLLQERAARLSIIKDKLDGNKITAEEARVQANATLDEFQPRIQAASDTGYILAETLRTALGPGVADGFIAALDRAVSSGTRLVQVFTQFQKLVGEEGSRALSNALENASQHLVQMAEGTESVKDGFRNMLVEAGRFFADFLRKIALAIIQERIFAALKNSGNPYLAAIGTAGSATNSVNHSGGIVGAVGNRSRVVPNAIFANAPRYHSGGIPGLAPDEYTSILQKNEEILSKDSPRNILNGGAAAGGQAPAPAGQRFVFVDERSKVPEAMQSPEGDNVIVQSIKRNLPTIRQMLK